MANAGVQGALEQRAARARVVSIVLERIRNGLGHDRVRGEVHHGVDIVGGEDLVEHLRVAGIADDEVAVQHGLAEAGRQVVEHDDPLTGLAELAHDVRADVAGSSGDQNCLASHMVN